EFDCDLSIDTAVAGPVMDESDAAQTVQAILAQVAAEEAAGQERHAAPQAEAPAPVRAAPPAAQAASAAPQQAASSQAPQRGATIRVDLDRVDRLIDLVGELVINQSMLAQRVMEAGIARLSDVAVGLDD